MAISEQEIRGILERVRRRYGGPPEGVAAEPRTAAGEGLGEGVHPDVGSAVEAAFGAYRLFARVGLERRRAVIERVREAMRAASGPLARQAHDETGLGRSEDKTVKNLLVTNKTPGPEDLEPRALTGDHGMTVTEFAPFGVIAAITPTTNPVATIINNTIATVSAGNAVVFNPHPAAKAVSAENVRLLNRAIVEAGGPADLVTTVSEPTIESAQQLMRHPSVRLLLVTGGPAVVKEALRTDKRAVTAGPGNPPVVVDETADLERAAIGLIQGASFDNNMVCTDEKEVFAVRAVADDLVRALERAGAVVLKEYQLRQLERVIFDELGEPGQPGRINRAWIGRNAGKILGEIGIAAGPEVRLVVARTPRQHSLVWTEQMMPVLPVVEVRNVDEGIDLAQRAEHGFRHTASIYSNDVEAITRMARVMETSIFVANAANFAGLGEGGEDFTSFSIATPTGEGLTRPQTFSRIRRLSVVGSMRIT